jgi:hypothetical protein
LIPVPIADPPGVNVCESKREQTRIIRRQFRGKRPLGAIFRGAPKEMLQLDKVSNLGGIMQDAISFKYIAKPLSAEQIGLLLQLPGAPGR